MCIIKFKTAVLNKIVKSIIKFKSNKPVAIQCLWDSDYGSIWLVIELIYKSHLGYKKKQINILEYGEFESTQNLVEEARRICKLYIERYNIELYFPSPDEWSRDCPDWSEANAAPKCEDCKVPIIQTDSEYLPKEVCYPCHLTRDQNERIKKAVPFDNGVTMYLFKDGKHEKIGYSTHFESFPISPYISDIVMESLFTNSINVITLEKPMIINLIRKLDNVIEKQLEVYEEPSIKPEMEKFISKIKVQFKDREIELMDRFNKNHENISRLISSYKTAQRALKESYSYQIYFKKGITYRDDSILRFIHYVSNGNADMNNLIVRYKNIITETELSETLTNLILKGCLTENNSEYSVTELGLRIL